MHLSPYSERGLRQGSTKNAPNAATETEPLGHITQPAIRRHQQLLSMQWTACFRGGMGVPGSLQFSGGLQADASSLSRQQLPSEPQLGDLGTSCCWKPDYHLRQLLVEAISMGIFLLAC